MPEPQSEDAHLGIQTSSQARHMALRPSKKPTLDTFEVEVVGALGGGSTMGM